jgi:DNA-binding transcriptional LysR family regulator
MVTIEQLEALDLVMWWRSGAAAALYCLCDESSITRRVRSTLKAFALKLVRKQEFQLTGDQGLLRLQRVVHQQARFCNHRPLRLEATHYISRQLTRPPVQGWMMGPCHHRGYGTLLSLLQERIIDAWVTSDLLDLPESPEFTVFKLWEWPGDLVVHPCHPLARERRPSRSDLDRFPSLILPESLYPKLTKAVQGKGFGQGRQLSRYDVGCWQGLTEDAVTITYGSCLSLDGDPNLTRLNWDLGLTGGEALVILSEWREEPAIALLLEDLRLRQLQLQKQHPQLVGLL